MTWQQKVSVAIRQSWRRCLLVGVAAALLSLMIGLLADTVFSAIARNIPALIRQDARLSLPLCDLLPQLAGCQPFVGLWTGLQIAEIAKAIGQVAGLAVNLMLVAALASYLSLENDALGSPAGALTGISAFISSLLLMILIGVPLWPSPALGIFSITALALLPVSGWLGARYGGPRLKLRLAATGLYTPTGMTTVTITGIEETLTERELEVLLLLAEGLKNREIAGRLHVSLATVKTHVLHIYGKLGVRSRTAAVRQALACGLLRYQESSPQTDLPPEP
jgi:DNA-binding CsgD family transcriptional regulator